MQHTQGSTSFVEETIKPLIHNYFGLTGTKKLWVDIAPYYLSVVDSCAIETSLLSTS